MVTFLKGKLKWICHHAHIDKSHTMGGIKSTLQSTLSSQCEIHMKQKWIMMQDIKRGYTGEDLLKRMEHTVNNLVKQNCKHIRTFIDVDEVVGLECIYGAVKLRDIYRHFGVNIQIAPQPLGGLVGNDKNIELYERACEYSDLIGCLPSIDGENAEEHLDIAFRTAVRLRKPIEAHLDQLNIPSENETEMFCDFVEMYDMRGMARSVHSISLSCKEESKQDEICARLSDLDIGVIICPSAGISMTQHSEYVAPIHNSLAPLGCLLKHNVRVGLGVDNIHDLFMPFCDGDLDFELRLLAEACRCYDIDVLKRIAENRMGF